MTDPTRSRGPDPIEGLQGLADRIFRLESSSEGTAVRMNHATYGPGALAITSGSIDQELNSALRASVKARPGDLIESSINIYVDSPLNVINLGFALLGDDLEIRNAFPPRVTFNQFFRPAGFAGTIDASAKYKVDQRDIRRDGTVMATVLIHTGGAAATVGSAAIFLNHWLTNLGRIE